jgi:hypothetical protein
MTRGIVLRNAAFYPACPSTSGFSTQQLGAWCVGKLCPVLLLSGSPICSNLNIDAKRHVGEEIAFAFDLANE